VAGSTNEAEIRALLERADRASAMAQREEAARLLAQAQALAPNHPLVLNSVGLAALNAGNPEDARRLFAAAIEGDGTKTSFWLNLATSCRKLSLQAEEMKALDAALALDPRYPLALLQKGSLLELQGRTRQAARLYGQALASVAGSTQLPESLRPALNRALHVARENDRALSGYLAEQVQPVRARHEGEERSRFDRALELLVGRRRAYHPQPSFLYFPQLPEHEYYDRSAFPWLQQLEQATAVIRAEFEQVLADDAGKAMSQQVEDGAMGLERWEALLSRSARPWSTFYLWREGKAVAGNLARCPRTAELLSQVPRPEMPHVAPTVFYSVLDARSRTRPHHGVTNARLIVHLPLITPPHCRLRVGSEVREWQAGTAWVYDDTIENEAVNESDRPNALLIFDVWNPYLSGAERELLAAATQAYGDYYAREAPAPGSEAAGNAG
jgi:aspartyl/asparaginyl beta-hydroxylase (cupin superfamily)